ncbi:HD domain-containing phosphohydrolase [Nonomuraea bangladeshensis]|uniref:HD domain-containing phosphohydrolase n=1 Tax=Nonomuraea bangladeshensis TaxID=404385 RepID=A0ABV3H9W1_9ACTN
MGELARALDQLRESRSYSKLAKAARPDTLPSSTLNNLLSGTTLPTQETLERYLRACGVVRDQRAAWHAARQRVASSAPQGLPDAVRVNRADQRRLGVHAAIRVDDAVGDLPAYVARDVDVSPDGVRALVTKAATRGGMVLLVGGSSVGKTRCAIEALQAVVPQWWLWHPADAAQIRQAATAPPGRLVVWLDELQRYLGGSTGLQAATVRTLLHARTVMIATLWPKRYTTYTAFPASHRSDPYAAERELLALADVVHLPASFSVAEQARAQAAADAGDRRIAVALQSADYGLTQTIAAAPQLVDRWNAADPYAAAVLNAAIDATRLGVISPISEGLLRAAAPGYCDPRQRAKAPAGWFETALAYATTTLNGAAAALAPISDQTTMGHISGYLVADYLQQHAEPQRRLLQVPAACWQAMIDHLTDSGDQFRTACSAQSRLLDQYAEPLYRQAINNSNSQAVNLLSTLLISQGRKQEAVAMWRHRAEAGDRSAIAGLADLQGEQDRTAATVTMWRRQAEAGDRSAAVRLTGLLIGQGQAEEARALWHHTSEIDVARNFTTDVAQALTSAMELKDPYLRHHSDRMSRLVALIVQQLKMTPDDVEAARLAALLHDIGKLALPSAVYLKAGALTEEEFAIIKMHVTHGASIVRRLSRLFEGTCHPTVDHHHIAGAIEGILHHHERFDGRGYPLGLAGEEIPQIARAIAVADAFDSMTTDRTYRSPRSIHEAVMELRKGAGSSFDPQIVEAFVSTLQTRTKE